MQISRKRTATLTPGRMVTAVWMMRQQVATRRALGGKRGHRSVGAVHGGKGNDPMLALLQEFNLPVTREDYLNLAYLGPPSEAIVGGGGGGSAERGPPGLRMRAETAAVR